jgi:hypothetical protein
MPFHSPKPQTGVRGFDGILTPHRYEYGLPSLDDPTHVETVEDEDEVYAYQQQAAVTAPAGNVTHQRTRWLVKANGEVPSQAFLPRRPDGLCH